MKISTQNEMLTPKNTPQEIATPKIAPTLINTLTVTSPDKVIGIELFPTKHSPRVYTPVMILDVKLLGQSRQLHGKQTGGETQQTDY